MQIQVDDAHKKLRVHQSDIDQMQQALKSVASNISSQQAVLSSVQQDITNQQADLHKILNEVGIAQTTLHQQQQQIANVEQLTRRLFSQMTVDTFNLFDTNSVVLGKKSDDGALIVFFMLSKPPIKESIRLQQGSENLFPNSFILFGSNIIGVAWKTGTDPESMKNEHIFIYYVADPAISTARSTILFDERGRILIDGRLHYPEVMKYRK